MERNMRAKYLMFFGIALTALFILVTHNGHGPMLGNLDVAMFREINQGLKNPVLDRLAATASDIGSNDLNILVYLLILCYIILLISIIRNNRELKILFLLLMIALFISGLIVDPLKIIFGVSRPYVFLNNVHVYVDGSWLNITAQFDKNFSFPSGHATITFALLGVLWIYNRLRILLLIFLFITMFLIVYVGQHYVSDIVAGGFAGFTIGYLVRRFYSYLSSHKGLIGFLPEK
jgi:undecaprenyl-diphosphatase